MTEAQLGLTNISKTISVGKVWWDIIRG